MSGHLAPVKKIKETLIEEGHGSSRSFCVGFIKHVTLMALVKYVGQWSYFGPLTFLKDLLAINCSIVVGHVRC